MRQAAAGMAETDAQLFGRTTYDKMAAFWPTVGDNDPFAKHVNHVTKYVASRNMTEATWEGTTVLNGDVAERVREIKERDGGTISVLGSADLAQTLMAHDLVDEYSLAIRPILWAAARSCSPTPSRSARSSWSTPHRPRLEYCSSPIVRPADQRCQCPPPQHLLAG
jgi:dihydrofolate reductase